MKTVTTHTGKIYVDTDKRLEFLYVGDYGKENNIKADFLGLTKEINGVENTPVDLHYKMVCTISTQKGCVENCRFCDCPKVRFTGNVSEDELAYEVETVLKDNCELDHTERFNLHFARMGEPTWNRAVLSFTENRLRDLVGKYIKADTVHPVVSTMLPSNNKDLEAFLMEWCRLKNEVYNGEAGLQLSINSTDEAQRSWLFKGMSMKLEDISALAKKFPKPVGRKYTLNFPVTKDTILDAKKLSSLFDKENFIVKITPIHETKAAVENEYYDHSTYADYDVYKKFEQPLLEEGWDVIVFIPSEEEDADRITCGNALISEENL